MRYTVDWEPDAEEALADIWLRSGFSPAVTSALARIDRSLERDPVGNGRLLREGLYQVVDTPLTAFYEIDLVGRRVEVTRVWYTP